MRDSRAMPVAVIGSGAAGLAAAFRLQQAGMKARLFERNRRLGGKMLTTRRDGFMMEEGPSAMAGSYHSILGIAREAGMGQEIVAASSLIAFSGADEKLHYLDATHFVRDGLRTRLISAASKLRLSRLLLDVLRTRNQRRPDDLSLLQDLDGISAEQYSRSRLGDEITDYLIDPCVRSFVNCPSSDISAADLLYVFGSFLGNRHYLAFRHGMSSYAEKLGEFCDIQLGAEVLAVREHGDAVDVVWRDSRGGEHTDTFAGVVIATDARTAAALHGGLDDWRREFLAHEVRYTWSTVTHVALDRRPDIEACFIFPGARAHPNLLIVSLEHNRTPWQTPPGKGLVGLYPASSYARELYGKSDDEIARILIAEGESLIPGLGDQVLFTHISRWHPTLLQSWPGYWRQMRKFAQYSDRRIQLAGDYFCTSSLNTASASGERGARRLLDVLRAQA